MSCTISGFLNFHVLHLNYEKFNLCLQNTLNMSKTTRVYFGALPKIETEIVPSLFCWNLKPIRNGISIAIYKIFISTVAIFTPNFFNNLLNCLFLVRNKYFINYAFLDKKISFKNKFKYTHLNIFHITYINSNNIQQTLNHLYCI